MGTGISGIKSYCGFWLQVINTLMQYLYQPFKCNSQCSLSFSFVAGNIWLFWFNIYLSIFPLSLIFTESMVRTVKFTHIHISTPRAEGYKTIWDLEWPNGANLKSSPTLWNPLWLLYIAHSLSGDMACSNNLHEKSYWLCTISKAEQ